MCTLRLDKSEIPKANESDANTQVVVHFGQLRNETLASGNKIWEEEQRLTPVTHPSQWCDILYKIITDVSADPDKNSAQKQQ